MDIFTWIFIVGPCVVLYLVFMWSVKVTLQRRHANINLVASQLEAMLSKMPQGGVGLPNPQHYDQISGMLAQLQTHMQQLNSIQRQRHDLRVGSIMGMAAKAGITWHP
jgi:hypothetical protein